MLILYTKADCPGCAQVKRLLRFLQVAYEERRVDEVPALRERLAALGFRSLPVAEVEGVGAVLGTDTPKLEQLLLQAGLADR